uniref:Uncharacterized protein n=1 Tax=Caenorhabditis japonica TaxID=281687 RepID=A0A8R1ENP9_CAEJA
MDSITVTLSHYHTVTTSLGNVGKIIDANAFETIAKFYEDYADYEKMSISNFQCKGNIVIEQENSTADRDQFEKDENIRIFNEETVGSVHSE